VLLRDSCPVTNRRPVSFLVYLWLTAEQAPPRRRGSNQLPGTRRKHRRFQKSSVQAAVSWLRRRKLLLHHQGKRHRHPRRYTALTPWKTSPAPPNPPRTRLKSPGSHSLIIYAVCGVPHTPNLHVAGFRVHFNHDAAEMTPHYPHPATLRSSINRPLTFRTRSHFS